MRFGKPAIPVATAPMDIRKGRMRISVTEISFGKAPMAVAVTAMGIEARGKGKGEGAARSREERARVDSTGPVRLQNASTSVPPQ